MGSMFWPIHGLNRKFIRNSFLVTFWIFEYILRRLRCDRLVSPHNITLLWVHDSDEKNWLYFMNGGHLKMPLPRICGKNGEKFSYDLHSWCQPSPAPPVLLFSPEIPHTAAGK
jgi:hypothetical protein